MKKSLILFLITISIYLFVPILILTIPSLFKYKFVFLTVIGISIYILFRLCKIKNSELGISKNNLVKSLKNNIPIIFFTIVIILIVKLFNFNRFIPNETLCFYLFYIFISCPIQEFLYRGVFGYFEDNLIKNKYSLLIISSLCYSFVHIIYRDLLTCIITFVIGVIWYCLYRQNKNLLGVTISHIILGVLTIYLGIIN